MVAMASQKGMSELNGRALADPEFRTSLLYPFRMKARVW
jgi:hypothetical protein